MSTTLQNTIKELAALPEDKQVALVERFDDMVNRAKIDIKLADSEARGGKTMSDTFFAELRAQYGN